MFCHQCRSPLVEDANFCSSCGAKQSKTVQEAHSAKEKELRTLLAKAKEAYDSAKASGQGYELALAYYTQAADLGSGAACSRLAHMYSCAEGCARDVGMLDEYIKRGAALGEAGCYYDWAGWCRIGAGSYMKDVPEAVRLYQLAAKLGSADACINLAEIYKGGEGTVRRDPLKALKWVKEAIDRGKTEGFVLMAKIYYELDEWANADKCWRLYFESEKFRHAPSSVDVSTYLTDMLLHRRRIDLLKAIVQMDTEFKANVILDITDTLGIWASHPEIHTGLCQIRTAIYESMGSDAEVVLSTIRAEQEELNTRIWGEGGIWGFVERMHRERMDPEDGA